MEDPARTRPRSRASQSRHPHRQLPCATQQFTATAKDSGGNTISGVTFTWASSATGVATISNSGLATGVSTGTTKIAASAGGVTSSANTLTITATQPAVSVSSTGPTTVDAGDTVSLGATVSNDSSNGGVIWTLSSNPTTSSSTTTTSATFVPSSSNTSQLSYTVTATSKDFPTVSSSTTITVNPLPRITSSGSIATATEGNSYSATLTESGGTGTLTWSLAGGTTLPAGLTLQSDGTLSGTPTGPAGTNFTFSALK